MRLRNFIVAAFVLAIAVPGIASAQQPEGAGRYSDFKVTGGGQIITDSEASGPGETVGFVAQEIEGDDEASPGNANDAARGQFQYNPHGADTDFEKFHGTVTCLISGDEALTNEENEETTTPEEPLDDIEDDEGIETGMARFGGYVKGGDAVNGPFFTVDVSDADRDADADGEPDDMILVRSTVYPCADNPEDPEQDNEPEDELLLGRGNIKIHNYRADNPAVALLAL